MHLVAELRINHNFTGYDKEYLYIGMCGILVML